uniref:Major sperm protein n=1 Tax=Toxocara canis TaxID=6265 RepID=A0A183U231_TOXCA
MNERSGVLGSRTVVVAQSVHSSGIKTQPEDQIVFNAPYDDKPINNIKITNSGDRRIGCAIKMTSIRCLSVDLPFSLLDPNDSVLMAVSYDTFNALTEDFNHDFVTVTRISTPDDAAQQSVSNGSRVMLVFCGEHPEWRVPVLRRTEREKLMRELERKREMEKNEKDDNFLTVSGIDVSPQNQVIEMNQRCIYLITS